MPHVATTYTEDEVALLKQRMMSGIRRVEFQNGNVVVFQSIAEMRMAIAAAEGALNGGSRVRIKRIDSYKG